jgi:SAM-dependent methyltransferase
MTATARSSYVATDGAAYHRFLGRWTERLAEPFAAFAVPDVDGDVLDVGCGTGSLAIEIARRAPDRQVIGADVAEPYLTYARQNAPPNAGFVSGEASQLQFADARFAATLAQLVLTFVPDPDRVVREMARVTRPGGVVAAAVWDFCGGLVYQRLFWDTAAVLHPAAGEARDRLFSHPLSQPDALMDLWTRAGLTNVATASLTVRMDYASFEDYWVPLLGGQGPVGSFIAKLDPPVLAAVSAAVRAAYLSGRPDGPRSLTATAWAVRGIVAAGGT